MPHSLRYTRLGLRTGTPFIALALIACTGIAPAPAPNQALTALPAPALIPQPVSLEREAGEFVLRDGAAIHATDPRVLEIAAWFGELVTRTRSLHLQPASGTSGTDGITFSLDPLFASTGEPADEAYALTVTAKGIVVRAATPHGLFNGATTLWQLLTPLDATRSADAAHVPLLHITDHPRFAWRGLMLDSARHLQSVEYIKQFIDAMALHKYNVLHWHLTDDQGWRIEIKRYPKLTEVGAWRRPAGHAGTDANGKATRYGGYYTQEQIREIVAYAQERYVTIVPEIEMPGHAQAAIAAYPALGVTGKNPGVSHDWGVHIYLYNVEDSTFIFMQNVLSEVMELFPSPYIHIGGDEAAKDQWQASARVQARMRKLGIANEAAMQAWFIKRIETFLGAHGRKLIGWDEILEGGLPPQATVMSWRGTKGAIEAAKQGHDVVLAPDPDLYLNNLPSDLPEEPAGRSHVVSLQSVFAFDPVPQELDASAAKHVLGAQANLWSEYLTTDASVTYATYPRAAALAEVLWSPPEKRNWPDFLDRLVTQQARYRTLGIGYAQSAFRVRVDADLNAASGTAAIKLSNQAAYGDIYYTLDGSTPTQQSTRYTAAFTTPAQSAIRATAFAHAMPLADTRTRALDPAALRQRGTAELVPCTPNGGVHLRLPDDRPANDHHTAYPVEIFDPCWVWPQADLDGITHIDASAARLPYNFQLWKDIKSVVAHQPVRYAPGEMQVHLDSCAGTLVAAAALAKTPANEDGFLSLSTALKPLRGRHDLCFRFATGRHDPLWVIDRVQLQTRE